MRALLLLLLLAFPIHAADWEPLTGELLKREKPGYGGLCGVVVDRNDGGLIVNVSDRGLFRSADAGKTWTQLGEPFKGRTETPGCMSLDPTGKSRRLLLPLVYGAPIIVGNADKGEWKMMHAKSAHVDWASIDWNDPECKFVLTLKHESGGLLLLSGDGGKSFTEIGKGFGPAWIFDDQIGLVAEMKTKEKPNPSLLRTTDGGKTFQPIAADISQSLPRWHGNSLYWLTSDGVIASSDKGATWKKLGELKDARFGPVFGADAKKMFVLTGAGIVESADGGTTWGKPIALPKALGGASGLTWLEYDPAADALYVIKMGTELFRLGRKE